MRLLPGLPDAALRAAYHEQVVMPVDGAAGGDTALPWRGTGATMPSVMQTNYSG